MFAVPQKKSQEGKRTTYTIWRVEVACLLGIGVLTGQFNCVLYSLILGDFLFPTSGDFKQVAYQRNKLYRCFPRSHKVPENDDTFFVLHELVNVW